MSRLAWMVVCRKASVDRDSNTVSLLEVAEGIIVLIELEQPPDDFVLPIHLELVSYWYRSNRDEPESPEARMRIFDRNNQPFGETALLVDLTTNHRLRSIIKSDGLRIRGAGTYFFTIEVMGPTGDWLEVGRIPFEISFARSQEAVATSTGGGTS
jgi:hypothetical protein